MEPRKEALYTRKVNQKPYITWWLADAVDVASHVSQIVTAIQSNQSDRRYQDLRHAYLYQNRQSSDMAFGATGMRGFGGQHHVTYNVAKSAVDTLTAKIAQNRPRPRILTERGDYQKQLRAKRLTQYIDGVLEAPYNKTYRQGSQAFKDGGIFGTGCIKIVPDYDRGRVCTERVLITEIVVDDLEAAYGKPQSMYQVRLVARDVLLRSFPDHALEIMRTAAEDSKKQTSNSVDLVKVTEAWHLPDAEGNDGRHVICLAQDALVDEPWAHDVFPFAFFRYQSAVSSFYGQGIIEELWGTQLEINKLLRDVQRAQHLIAVPRILAEQNSKISSSHFNNEIGSIVKYMGTEPKFINPIAMNNEIYSHIKWLIQSCYEKVGISQLSASSKKPGGLDSKVALREFQDIESERFASTEANYKEFFEEIAQRIILFSRDLAAAGDLKIRAESRKFIEDIDWNDVSLDDDCMVTRVYISSIFPTQPAAKLAKIQEYVQSGWMSHEDGLREMAFPDVEAWETLETADRDYVEHSIANILGEGKYIPPEPEMLLANDITIARKHYLEALNTGADPDRVELLLRWIEAAASIRPAPAPVALPPAVAPGNPAAVPVPLPQSDLLPVS